jgi:hypothetical protein
MKKNSFNVCSTFTGYTQRRFQRLDSLLTYLNDNNKFMGSVSYWEGNQVVFSKLMDGVHDEEK